MSVHVGVFLSVSGLGYSNVRPRQHAEVVQQREMVSVCETGCSACATLNFSRPAGLYGV